MMKELYLLAVSLLTGLAIPASTIPQVSIIRPENSLIEWNLKQGSQLTLGKRIIPSGDTSLPEVSNQALQPIQELATLKVSSLQPIHSR